MSKICFVTSSLVGPTLNGGVGTAMYYQAYLMQEKGHEITILFNGNYQVKNAQYWKKAFAKLNIEFCDLIEQTSDISISIKDTNWWIWRSYHTMQWLKTKEYDIVHFAETCGYAYHTLQAKRTLNKFFNTKIVVTMHSPTEWIYEGNQIWPYEVNDKDKETRLFLKLNFAERYVCEHADYLLAPSKTMFEWAINKNWTLSSNRKVLFNPYFGNHNQNMDEIDLNHIIFFGVLDKRKGIDVFCEAICEYCKSNPNEELKVSFLGRKAEVDGETSQKYIEKVLGNLDIRIIIHDDFDTYKANEYIKSTGGLAVLCSRQDNSPYSVIECIDNNVPFICSNIGGIPELVDEKILFELNTIHLKNKLEEVKNIQWQTLQHKYNYVKANQLIVDNNERILLALNNERIDMKDHKSNQLVSICLAYYNHGRYIREVLKNLEQIQYNKYEIIIIDDGSTEKGSIEIFDMLSKQEEKNIHDIRFIKKTHLTKGGVYNLCAQEAKGEYLFFMNFEDIITQNCLEKMSTAIENAKVDVVTAYSQNFKGIGAPNVMNVELEINAPLGGIMEDGLIDFSFNSFAFLIKKVTFQKIGGMIESDEYGVEHCLIAKGLKQGYKLEVIPEVLGWKRSFATTKQLGYGTTPSYGGMELVLNAYFDNSVYMKYFMKNWCLPRFFDKPEIEDGDNGEQENLADDVLKTEKNVLEKQNQNLVKTLSEAQADAISARKELSSLNQEHIYAQTQINNLQLAIDNMEDATFWKLTKPLRYLIGAIRGNKK